LSHSICILILSTVVWTSLQCTITPQSIWAPVWSSLIRVKLYGFFLNISTAKNTRLKLLVKSFLISKIFFFIRRFTYIILPTLSLSLQIILIKRHICSIFFCAFTMKITVSLLFILNCLHLQRSRIRFLYHLILRTLFKRYFIISAVKSLTLVSISFADFLIWFLVHWLLKCLRVSNILLSLLLS